MSLYFVDPGADVHVGVPRTGRKPFVSFRESSGDQGMNVHVHTHTQSPTASLKKNWDVETFSLLFARAIKQVTEMLSGCFSCHREKVLLLVSMASDF